MARNFHVAIIFGLVPFYSRARAISARAKFAPRVFQLVTRRIRKKKIEKKRNIRQWKNNHAESLYIGIQNHSASQCVQTYTPINSFESFFLPPPPFCLFVIRYSVFVDYYYSLKTLHCVLCYFWRIYVALKK